MKKKFTKQDYINISLLILLFCGLIFFLVKTNYLLGSHTDWDSQHVSFPEYFRTLFYDTKNLFPNLALNIGAGQNIYNFAYYGLLSPIIFISYLFPKLSMVHFIMISSAASILASIVIFYRFLNNHKFKKGICFFATLLFMCATPLLFHTHRHIMFINYMPFLLLGLHGVDRYFAKNQKAMLTISVFLMIMTSYYYSVVGIIVLVLYGVFSYLKKTKKVTVKDFFSTGFKFVVPIFIGILCSAILIVPTFYVILHNRGEISTFVTLKDVLIPNINLNYILYKSYGIGLTSIVILAIIHLISKKEREYRFLGITLASLIIFPFINYILNATMYIDAKILVPFVPLAVFAIAIFIKDFFEKKVNLKKMIPIFLLCMIIGFPTAKGNSAALIIDVCILLISILLYHVSDRKVLFAIPISLVAIVTTYFISADDSLVLKGSFFGQDYKDQATLIHDITKEDQSFYRLSNQVTPLQNTNRIYEEIDYYQTTLYSSTYDVEYNKFYYDVMNNAVQSRNRVITSSPKNYPFLLLTANKYLLSNSRPFIGYEKIKDLNHMSLYKNDNALPLGFASPNTLSLQEFNKMDYPENQEAILNNIIVDKKTENDFRSHLKKINFEFVNPDWSELNMQKEGDTYILNLSKKTELKLNLKETYENQLIYIRFVVTESMPCSKGDLNIVINNINNKLTCSSWKYHNQNYTFDYVLAYPKTSKLHVTFDKGIYKIKDIETYALDSKYIDNLNEAIDPLQVDKKQTKGDKIVGDIDVKKDGYFTISIPYDEGFTFKVDGQKTPYEKTNVSFMGFPIKEGKHKIEITYKAPWRNIGVIISIIGGILLIGEIILDIRLKKKRLSVEGTKTI